MPKICRPVRLHRNVGYMSVRCTYESSSAHTKFGRPLKTNWKRHLCNDTSFHRIYPKYTCRSAMTRQPTVMPPRTSPSFGSDTLFITIRPCYSEQTPAPGRPTELRPHHRERLTAGPRRASHKRDNCDKRCVETGPCSALFTFR